MVPGTMKFYPFLSVLVASSLLVTLMVYQIKGTPKIDYLQSALTHPINFHEDNKDTNTNSMATDAEEWSNPGMKQNSSNHHPNSMFVYPGPSSLAFEKSPVIPYFYRIPQTHHPSDKYRKHQNLDVSLPDLESNQSKLILFYNPADWAETACSIGLRKCPIKSCECSINKSDLRDADGVIFNGVDLRMTPMTKHANQMWIFFAMEPPLYFSSSNYKEKQWRQMFNWTMTYRQDSDVPIPYDILLHLKVSKNYTAIALNKTRSALWLVSNCNTPGKRELFVEELKKYYNVDIFGKCNKGRVSPPTSFINQYRFYLAFENSFCFDYVTEKFFNTYGYHNVTLIPVVRGGADYDTMFPKGTFINAAHFNSPRELGNYLSYLENNLTAYAEYLQRHDQFVTEGVSITFKNSFCDICVKLHNLKRYDNWYTDIYEWFNDGTCYTPTDY